MNKKQSASPALAVVALIVVGGALFAANRMPEPQMLSTNDYSVTTPAMPLHVGHTTIPELTSAAPDKPYTTTPATSTNTPITTNLANRFDADWRKSLTSAQYNVLRQSGTEAPFTSPLLHESRPGTYVTADCGIPVFRSEQKFDSGTGWPSFWAPINKNAVSLVSDTTLVPTRTEVREPKCNSHLGHVFHDAPQTPTGDRYCMNGVALRFIPD